MVRYGSVIQPSWLGYCTDGARKVYIVGDGGKRWITSPDELNAWQRGIIPGGQTTQAVMDTIPTLPGVPG